MSLIRMYALTEQNDSKADLNYVHCQECLELLPQDVTNYIHEL